MRKGKHEQGGVEYDSRLVLEDEAVDSPPDRPKRISQTYGAVDVTHGRGGTEWEAKQLIGKGESGGRESA